MPSTFGSALREQFGRRTVLAGVLALAIGVALGFDRSMLVAMCAAFVLAGLVDAAVEAEYVHRRTLQAGLGVVVLSFGLVMVALGTTDPLWVVALALGGGGWITLDGITARRAGIDGDSDQLDDPDAAEMMVTMGITHRIFDELREADQPMAARELADACDLTEGRAESTLSLLADRGMVERHGDGYVANDAYVGRLSSARTLGRQLLARIVRPFSLLVASRHA
jgi:hypothetical protein